MVFIIYPETVELFEQLQEIRPARFFLEMEESGRGMGFILFFLARSQKQVTPGELCRQSGVSSARIAKLLKSLEEKGLIIREPSPEDGRSTIVRITPEGRDLTKQIHQEILQKLQTLTDLVGKEDMQELIRICRKISDHLEEVH